MIFHENGSQCLPDLTLMDLGDIDSSSDLKEFLFN